MAEWSQRSGDRTNEETGDTTTSPTMTEKKIIIERGTIHSTWHYKHPIQDSE